MSKFLNWLPLTLLVLFLFGGSCYKLGKIRADRWHAKHTEYRRLVWINGDYYFTVVTSGIFDTKAGKVITPDEYMHKYQEVNGPCDQTMSFTVLSDDLETLLRFSHVQISGGHMSISDGPRQ